jgi:DNA-binding HxlR family transcriptional regulator
MSQEQAACPVEITLSLLGNKWKVLILRELFTGTKRFGELSRGVPGISQKMLTQQLRQMEADKLVQREVYAEVPPHVEYSLTEVGRSLSPILDAMHKWGTEYRMLKGKKGTGKMREDNVWTAKGTTTSKSITLPDRFEKR